MNRHTLELRQLSIARSGAVLLPPFDYRLGSGDLLVLQGPNGSGKSSLLKSLAGLLPPASGEILFDGKPVNEISRTNVVYFSHKLGLSSAMSVEENVAFWAHITGQGELVGAALHYF